MVDLAGRDVCIDSKSQPICGHLMPTWSPIFGPCYHVTTYCHHPLHHRVCYYASPPPWMMYPYTQTHPHTHLDQTHHIPPSHVDEAHQPLSCPHPFAYAYAYPYPYPYPHPHPHPHPHHANVTDPHPHPHPYPDETDPSHKPHAIDPHTHPYPLHAHVNDSDPHPHPHPNPYVLCQHCSNLLLLPFPLPHLDGPNPNLKLKCGQCLKISAFSSDQLHRRGIPASEVVTSSLISGPDALHGSDSERLFSGQFARIDNFRPRQSVDSSGVNVAKDYIEERHIKSHGVTRRRVKLYDLLHGNNPLDSSNSDKLQFNLSNNCKLQFNSSRSDKLDFDKSRGGKLHFDSSRSDKQQFDSSNTGELHFDKSRVGKMQFNSSKSGKLRINSSNAVELYCGSIKGAKLQYDSTNAIKKPQCDSTNGVKLQCDSTNAVKLQCDSTNGFESRNLSFGLKRQYESTANGVKVNDTSNGIELHDTSNNVELPEPSSTMDDSKTNDLIFSKMNPDGLIRHSPNEIEDGVFPNKLIAIQDWVNAIATQAFETYPHEEEVMPNFACTSCTSPTRNFAGNAYSEDESEREPQLMFSCRSTPSTTNHITKGYYYGKRRVFSSDAIHVKESSSRKGEGEAKDVQRSVSSLLKKLRLKDYPSEKRIFFASNLKQRVVVNGEVLSKSSLKKAEERAGKLRPGSYWCV